MFPVSNCAGIGAAAGVAAVLNRAGPPEKICSWKRLGKYWYQKVVEILVGQVQVVRQDQYGQWPPPPIATNSANLSNLKLRDWKEQDLGHRKWSFMIIACHSFDMFWCFAMFCLFLGWVCEVPQYMDRPAIVPDPIPRKENLSPQALQRFNAFRACVDQKLVMPFLKHCCWILAHSENFTHATGTSCSTTRAGVDLSVDQLVPSDIAYYWTTVHCTMMCI